MSTGFICFLYPRHYIPDRHTTSYMENAFSFPKEVWNYSVRNPPFKKSHILKS